MDEAEPTDRMIPYPKWSTIVAAVCCVFFILAGVLGNLVTVIALVRCKKLRNATTDFVISLCIADLLFCAINLPLTASRYIHEEWLLGDTMCQLFPFFFYGNVGASLMSMVAITINRYILINHHRWYSKIYRKRYIVIMMIVYWAFSFGILVPPLAGVWGRLGYHPETFSCTILATNGKSPKKFLFVLGFLIPCVVIIVSYSCIFYKVYRSRKSVVSHSAPNSPTWVTPSSPTSPTPNFGLSKDELRLTKLMVVIFCSFLVCFLPLMIVNVFDNDISIPTFHVLASILAWMSSCINPMIYVVLNRQYRKAYCKLLCPSTKWSQRWSSKDNQMAKSYSNGTTKLKGGPGSVAGSKTILSDVFTFNTKPGANSQTRLSDKKVNELLLEEVAI